MTFLSWLKQKFKGQNPSDTLQTEEVMVQKERLLTLRLDLINKCNLRCIMCHFADDKIFKQPVRQYSLEEFKAFFDDIAPVIKMVMLSCGCEPLLAKDLAGIMRYLAREHPEVEMELCTNAVLMDESIRSLFIETGLTHVMISFDGVTRETFESIRTGAKYDRVIGNVIALRDLKQQAGTEFPRVILNFVMLDRNMHEAPWYIKMASELGAFYVDFHHAVSSGMDAFPHEEVMTKHPAKFNYYRSLVEEEGRRYKMSIVLPPAIDTQETFDPQQDPDISLADFQSVSPDPHSGPIPSPKPPMTNPAPRDFASDVHRVYADVMCNRPFSEIMLRDMDEVLPCPWYGKPIGKLSDGKTLNDIFMGPEFTALRENMRLHKDDPLCSNCPIKSHELSGQVENVQ